MHYKTRTYLDKAIIVRSTGCDMNEVWSMYAKISLWSSYSPARDLSVIRAQLKNVIYSLAGTWCFGGLGTIP